MPGSVSDSFDPEWGTGANREEIENNLQDVYRRVSLTLSQKPPMFILDLVQSENLEEIIEDGLTEKEWRLIRFALERAIESL